MNDWLKNGFWQNLWSSIVATDWIGKVECLNDSDLFYRTLCYANPQAVMSILRQTIGNVVSVHE